MLGHWKNFEELETNLTIEELLKILDAAREREAGQRKFMAQLQGISLEDEENGDITELSGNAAHEAGIGIGMGLGYQMEVAS